MKRRALLSRTAALGALALAGCTSSGDPGTGTPTPTDTPPAIDTTSIETRGSDCGSGDDGRVDVLEADASNHRLTIKGTLPASNPCYLAELAGTDLADGTLAVTVGVRRDEEVEACADCVGEVDYEASIQLTGGDTVEIVVDHEYADEGTEVERETVEL